MRTPTVYPTSIPSEYVDHPLAFWRVGPVGREAGAAERVGAAYVRSYLSKNLEIFTKNYSKIFKLRSCGLELFTVYVASA